jgi:hypothetical protein
MDDLATWRKIISAIECDELRLAAPVLDLAAYREAAERIAASRYCFLNSYSVILADKWLRALELALAAPGVGLVGATGSWGSVRSYNRFMLGFRGPYARVFSDRRATNAALAAATPDRDVPSHTGRKHEPVRFLSALLEQSYGFASFPAPHVRTNGFMIAREVLTRIKVPYPRRKADAYRLESGRKSITAQVRQLELAARVVARDGQAYDVDDWARSHTFWQGRQENLLIADNQTRDYEDAEGARREALSRYAWGLMAEPT